MTTNQAIDLSSRWPNVGAGASPGREDGGAPATREEGRSYKLLRRQRPAAAVVVVAAASPAAAAVMDQSNPTGAGPRDIRRMKNPTGFSSAQPKKLLLARRLGVTPTNQQQREQIQLGGARSTIVDDCSRASGR